jgi:hypothetical protein
MPHLSIEENDKKIIEHGLLGLKIKKIRQEKKVVAAEKQPFKQCEDLKIASTIPRVIGDHAACRVWFSDNISRC